MSWVKLIVLNICVCIDFLNRASTISVPPRAPKYCYFRQILGAIMTSIRVKMAYETVI